jgi:uncharacterized SAM-binding protein YcdF (DUF218 family)
MANDFSARKDNSQLPSMAEVHKIRTIEAKRPHASDVEGIYFAQFDAIIALLKAYGFSTAYFDKAVSTHAVTPDDLKEFESVLGELAKKIASENEGEKRALLDAAYDYLAEEDQPEKADIAIVLGGKSEERPRKAAELYKRGLFPKIVCAGSRPVYVDASGPSEAEIFRDILIKEGVPESAILMEKNSRTVPDNIRSVLNQLDEKKLSYARTILITSPYCMRRAWACLKKYVSKQHVVMRVACKTEGISRETWFGTEKSARILLNEYVKMAIACSFGDA